MKKSIICLALAVGLMASCDPIKEEKDLKLYSISESALNECVTITQTDVNGNSAADGNYFQYTTSPVTEVSVFHYKADGTEELLAHGVKGSFVIAPKRGSDPNQTYYLRVVNTDGSVTLVEKKATVFVKQDLDPELQLLASDEYGSKTWYWDPSVSGTVWGNMGYCGGAGSDVGISGNGQWWGVGLDDDGELSGFLEQLQHTPDGKVHGDESIKAYMVIDEDNNIVCYDKDGNVIRQGSYSVSNFDNSDPTAWKVGDLITTSILWPYEINSGGNVPGTYEIVYLTADKMTLVYPDGGNYAGLGAWGEATYWHFTSNDDVMGMAAGYSKNGAKDWTWDYDGENTVWGNMGYCGGNGADVGVSHNGQWWGVVSADGFADQVNHTTEGALQGDEQEGAYFSLALDGSIVRYSGSGSVINKGSFELNRVSGNAWKVADLNTTAGTILWPYEINSGGNQPTTFEVVYLTNGKMCLVYPDGGNFGALGAWGEATYWHFKAK